MMKMPEGYTGVNNSVLLCAQHGDIDGLKKLCATVPKVTPMLMRHKDNSGTSFLLIAAANNCVEIVQFLIDVILLIFVYC
jgi:hypothetical protein